MANDQSELIALGMTMSVARCELKSDLWSYFGLISYSRLWCPKIAANSEAAAEEGDGVCAELADMG